MSNWQKNSNYFVGVDTWTNREKNLIITDPIPIKDYEFITGKDLQVNANWIVEFGNPAQGTEVKPFRTLEVANNFISEFKRRFN
jgi:hypothetical protein